MEKSLVETDGNRLYTLAAFGQKHSSVLAEIKSKRERNGDSESNIGDVQRPDHSKHDEHTNEKTTILA